jgi:hypothetical protein
VLDPVSDERWSRFVERAPQSCVFHHPLWLRLLRDCYRYPMSAVCVARSDGELVAGLPIAEVRSRLTGSRLVSVPFSDVCGPLVTAAGSDDALLTAVDAHRRQAGLSLEVHADVQTLPSSATSARFVHHIVPLDGEPDAVVKRVRREKRRGASRARRLGVEVRRRTDREAVGTFFRLHAATRHRLGVPTQPRRFFYGLVELFAHGLGFVLLAEWQGQPIAAAVYLQHQMVLTCKYSAWDVRHHDKYANDLIQIEAIRLAADAGCSALDMGRAELADTGLRRFKHELGAVERELTYTTAPPAKRKSGHSVPKLQRSLIQRSPGLVGELLGSALYRHVA